MTDLLDQEVPSPPAKTGRLKAIAIIYGLLGFLFVTIGIIALFFPNLAFPKVSDGQLIPEYYDFNHGTIIHLTRELGASFIALGSLLLWGCLNVTKAAKLDILFLGYFTLTAGLQWYEFLRGDASVYGVLLNSIPLLLFILVVLLRQNIERKEN